MKSKLSNVGGQSSKREVMRFLETTRFTGYQGVPLPFGLQVPGRDISRRAGRILADRVKGKSVLDIGTYYGVFAVEAMSRGATRVVGLEADRERYSIARKIAELYGDSYDVVFGRVEEIDLKEKFDVVLFLNVLHHVTDPIQAMSSVVSHCKGIVIVEFCLPDDPKYIERIYLARGRSKLRRLIVRVNARIVSVFLRAFCNFLPLMAIGDQEYDRTFYFSPKAFHNCFVVHNKMFSAVEFFKSDLDDRRRLAICRVNG